MNPPRSPTRSRTVFAHSPGVIRYWWIRRDLNPRPSPCKGAALPDCATDPLAGVEGFEPPK